MEERRPEVADVFRKHAGKYLERYGASSEARRVLRDLSRCRTAALGGHKKECPECGHEEFFYNSCRNRHCPKCQGAARAKWLAAREADLLPVEYFHLVFTLPETLGPIASQNKALAYNLLFRAVSETLLEIGRDERHLGAELGFLALLHTWGQRLNHHPHIHCVVPGGGLSKDRSRWISARKGFFLPVRVLSRLFRGKFIASLARAYREGELEFRGKLAHLAEDGEWERFLEKLKAREWVVYSKPPFGGPKQVLKYLARYTHRVAISNQRLLSLCEDGKVTFSYKDYSRGDAQREMTLEATEFIRRFLQHVLPPSFHRIRSYGFLSNRARRQRLPEIRKLLGEEEAFSEASSFPSSTRPPEDSPERNGPQSPQDDLCPVCKKGRLVSIELERPSLPVPTFDTS